MVSIIELKRIREREASKLKIMNKKLLEVRKIDAEKQKIIKDIRRIKTARLRDKAERQAKANRELRIIKSQALRTGKKVGKKVLDFLYAMRGE